ncbi:5'-methylthioadenosine phosphorylase domain protein [Mycobacterium xenopi 3993]|nr:5'-methylthioadenosine phosphorylase domain protein [Mycobacterium xenopi 3993]
MWAEYSWRAPCRGRNATSCRPTVPTVTGALGAPYGCPG